MFNYINSEVTWHEQHLVLGQNGANKRHMLWHLRITAGTLGGVQGSPVAGFACGVQVLHVLRHSTILISGVQLLHLSGHNMLICSGWAVMSYTHPPSPSQAPVKHLLIPEPPEMPGISEPLGFFSTCTQCPGVHTFFVITPPSPAASRPVQNLQTRPNHQKNDKINEPKWSRLGLCTLLHKRLVARTGDQANERPIGFEALVGVELLLLGACHVCMNNHD